MLDFILNVLRYIVFFSFVLLSFFGFRLSNSFYPPPFYIGFGYNHKET